MKASNKQIAFLVAVGGAPEIDGFTFPLFWNEFWMCEQKVQNTGVQNILATQFFAKFGACDHFSTLLTLEEPESDFAGIPLELATAQIRFYHPAIWRERRGVQIDDISCDGWLRRDSNWSHQTNKEKQQDFAHTDLSRTFHKQCTPIRSLFNGTLRGIIN